MASLPYATRLRLRLAESKRQGVPFEQAWKAATRATRPDRDEFGWPMEYTKRVMRDAYCALTAPNRIGAIAERDRLYVQRYHEAERFERKTCGWGLGCDKPADPYLCAEHGAIIRNVRGALCLDSRCRQEGRAPNNAVRGEDYCARHAPEAVAA